MNGLFFFAANCKKLLDSGSISEHDGEMFCNSCYRKNFGPKGYGFGGGAGCLSMDDGKGYTVRPVFCITKANIIVNYDSSIVNSTLQIGL